MKHLILLSCFVGLLAYKGSAQTTASVSDSTVWGSVQNNFPGGQDAYDKYVTDSATYPKLALDNHIMGSVYLNLTIEDDGSLSNVKVFHDIGSQMDEAAQKLIRHSGKWAPTLVNGKPVRTICNVPVNYVLTTNHNHEVFGAINGLSPQASLTSLAIAPNVIMVSPPLILLKDVNTNLGMMVTIKDVVYSHQKVDAVETLVLGGQHPHELLTVILSGAALEVYKNKNLDGKTILVTGTPEINKGDHQLFISNPQYISLRTH